MAFITISDMQSDLPNGFNSAQADRLLVKIESQLKQLGFVFDTVDAESRKIEADKYGQSVFDFGYVRNITQIRLGRYSGDYINLIENDDYIVVEHPNIDGTSYRIELNDYCLKYPQYLEVTGEFGLYINFADNTSFGVKLLKSAVIDFITKYLNVYKSQGIHAQGIKSAGTGQSRVTYGDSLDSSASSFRIESDPDFSEALSYFILNPLL